MPKKRLRKAAALPIHGSKHESREALDLLCSAGVSGVVGLLGWLWTSFPDQSRVLGHRRFKRLAPATYLASHLPAYLESLALIRRAPVAMPSLRTVGPEDGSGWVLADCFKSVSEAESAILFACRILVTRSTFLLEARGLWVDTGVCEVVGFLEAELQDHQFDPAWAVSVESIIHRGLDRLPVAECFYFCWLSVRDLASAYLRQPHTRDRLHETLKRSLESKMTRAHAERWITRPFARHVHNPESAMAFVFAFVLTALGGKYLSVRPSEDALEEAVSLVLA